MIPVGLIGRRTINADDSLYNKMQNIYYNKNI